MKILIGNKEVSFFTAGKINLKLDSVASTFALSCRFNPENDEHKELFKPLQFKNIVFKNSQDKVILTGTILNHSFSSNKDVKLISISGYSKSGIIEDVTIPPSLYPLENTNLTLREITQKLCSAYGLKLRVGSNVGNIDIVAVDSEEAEEESNLMYKKTVASPSDTVKGYLSKLTAQRNILLSHNAAGDIMLFKPNVNAKPKYFFNSENTLSMGSLFSGQGLHSDISVVRQPSEENEGVATVDTIKNPLIGKFRPTTKVLSSGEDTDTSKAANNVLSTELKNISIKVELLGLFDTLYPGDIVNIHNHWIYSFAYSRWMVGEIELSFDEKSETTSLTLYLPETFSGQVPRNILFAYDSHQRDI